MTRVDENSSVIRSTICTALSEYNHTSQHCPAVETSTEQMVYSSAQSKTGLHAILNVADWT